MAAFPNGQEKRGRSATGRHPMIGFRASPDLANVIDAAASEQKDKPSRSKMIRRIVTMWLGRRGFFGSAAPPSTAGRKAGASCAERVAGERIDREQGSSVQSAAVKADRKSSLMKKPSELSKPRLRE